MSLIEGFRDGATFQPSLDLHRLNTQARTIFTFTTVTEPFWHTLTDISRATGYPEASVSARLRDFRKERFGGHTVLRRRASHDDGGLWEYKVIMRADS